MDARRELLALGSLEGPVEVLWDRWGIPHVFAGSIEDAYVALGFACARERLWQIELTRIVSRGTAASVLGERMLRSDAIMRTFDVPVARGGRAHADGDGIAEAYAAGVNAWVDRLDEVPPEFVSAGSEPRRIDLDDIAAMHRHSSWLTSRDWAAKVAMARAVAAHGPELWRGHLTRLTDEDIALATALGDAYSALDPGIAYLAAPVARTGSNNWAIAAERSVSGKPILASDPHLAFRLPPTWFLAHLVAPGLEVMGATFPGQPVFAIGHTRRTAWGLTAGFIDCYEVYVEELDGSGRCRTPEGWQPLEQREERIEVKGRDPFALPVHRSPNGPLFEPLLDALGESRREAGTRTGASLRWAIGATPTAAGAWALLPQARDADEMASALFDGAATPMNYNVICADDEGRLRRFVNGCVFRRSGVTGVLPLPGWDARYRWDLVPPEELMVEIDPPNGFLATANNDTVGDALAYPVHNYPGADTRVRRIRELLAGAEKLDRRRMQAMQLDLLDTEARDLVPVVVELLAGDEDDRVARGCAVLRDWDFRAEPDSAGACVYYAFAARPWFGRFRRAALEARGLDPAPTRELGVSGSTEYRGLRDILLNPDSPWREHDELLRASLRESMRDAVRWLDEELGSDPGGWSWQDIHRLAFRHTLARQPGFEHLRIGPDGIGGSGGTLAVAGHTGRGPFRAFHGPELRMVVDLADPTHPGFVLAAGNSGRRQSPHCLDQHPVWRAGEFIDLCLEREELEPSVEEVWELY